MVFLNDGCATPLLIVNYLGGRKSYEGRRFVLNLYSIFRHNIGSQPEKDGSARNGVKYGIG